MISVASKGGSRKRRTSEQVDVAAHQRHVIAVTLPLFGRFGHLNYWVWIKNTVRFGIPVKPDPDPSLICSHLLLLTLRSCWALGDVD